MKILWISDVYYYEQLLFLITFIKCFIFLWQGISPFCYAFFKKIDVHFLKTETHIITVLSYTALQKMYIMTVL